MQSTGASLRNDVDVQRQNGLGLVAERRSRGNRRLPRVARHGEHNPQLRHHQNSRVAIGARRATASGLGRLPPAERYLFIYLQSDLATLHQRFVIPSCGLWNVGVQYLPSLFALLRLDLPAPDHSTLSRRVWSLEIDLGVIPHKGAAHLLIDSSEFNVYGEGKWKVRQHGVGKRRTWRKLHIGVDESTGQIAGAMGTGAGWGDSSVLPDILDQVLGEVDPSQCRWRLRHRFGLPAIADKRNYSSQLGELLLLVQIRNPSVTRYASNPNPSSLIAWGKETSGPLAIHATRFRTRDNAWQ